MCEVREYDKTRFAVYTENEEARRRLKTLAAFDGESRYFIGKSLVAVDVFLIKSKLPAQLRRQLAKEARQNGHNGQA